jgi:PBP4 family serine-type D-alanyl-D-alanine carboxypeptidase
MGTMATRFKSLKSTFLFLFIIGFLYTWKAQAAELPTATKAKLHQIIGKLENAGAQVGLEIDDIGTVKNPQQFPAKSTFPPKVLFSYRATQSYMSASNWKLFTTFYALNSKVPDSARDTEIRADSDIENDGTLKGNLYLFGHSDPSLNIEQLHQAALVLKEKGLERVTGNVIVLGGGSAETLGGRYPFGWTLDDALWYYAPPIGTLAINRNQVDVYITGGKNPGDAATVTYSPALPDLQMAADVKTGTADLAKKSADDLLHWDRFEGNGKGFSMNGRVAPGQQITEGIALGDPELMAAKVLLNELRKVGIKVDGTADEKPFAIIFVGAIRFPLYTIPAPSLKVLLTKMLKHSDNFYAEMILRSSNPQLTTVPKIRPELFALLKKSGINISGLRMEDGSGLSRYTLITPNAMTQLLNAVQKLPREKGEIFWNALPIAGVDGTLGKRMKSTFAQNNVRAKTGTFSTACNLSGYVTTRDGHRLAISFLMNFGPDTDICRAAQDQAFELLAAGKLQ